MMIDGNNKKNTECQVGNVKKVFYHCIIFKKSYINVCENTSWH